LRYPTSDAGITYKKEKSETTGGLNCAAGFGSLMAVTASFGMQASAYVLTKLADSR
jgi:tRNA A37 threonylcarbamoyladenosine dehydratase